MSRYLLGDEMYHKVHGHQLGFLESKMEGSVAAIVAAAAACEAAVAAAEGGGATLLVKDLVKARGS